MRSFLTTTLALLSTAGFAHAQCDDFFESFEANAIGDPVTAIPGWTGNAGASVQVGTGLNFSQVLRVDTATGSTANAVRPMVAPFSTSFGLSCDAKAAGTCAIRLVCGGSTIGGIDFNAMPGFAASIDDMGMVNLAGTTAALIPDFAPVVITGVAGGTISASYNGVLLGTYPWPASCTALSEIQFTADLPGISALEVDDVCVGLPPVATMPTMNCSTIPNSTGLPTGLAITGSDVASANNVTLHMNNMPPAAVGYFLNGTAQGLIPMPGSSMGNLCIASVGRFLGPGQVGPADANGMLSVTIDLTAFARPTGPVTVVAGQTWFFQGWHRDTVGGAPTSNFSDALSVLFM